MLEYILKNPKFFIKYFDSIASLNDEGIIEFGNKIRIMGIDRSRIAIFELIIGEDNLEIINDQNVKIPLCLADLQKILKRLGSPEELIIKYDNKNCQLIIEAQLDNKKKTFKLNETTLDDDLRQDPIPTLLKLQMNSIFKIKADDFLDAIEDCLTYMDMGTLYIKDNTFSIYTTSINGSCKTEINLNSEVFSEETAEYSFEWLRAVLKPMRGSDIIVMYRKDYPIQLYDKLSEKSHMRWYVAPRVSESD